MTHKDIVRKTHCTPRTIRYALRKFKEKKLLIEKMNMQDMRQIIYQYRVTPLPENEADRVIRHAVTGSLSDRRLYEGYD